MKLTIRFRGQELMVRDLREGTLTLGRSQPGVEADVDIPVEGDFLSDQHGHFVVDGDIVEVVDGWPGGHARSVFGVHVNGIRVDRFEIEPGDVVAFGDPSDAERHVEMLVDGDENVMEDVPDFTGEIKRHTPIPPEATAEPAQTEFSVQLSDSESPSLEPSPEPELPSPPPIPVETMPPPTEVSFSDPEAIEAPDLVTSAIPVDEPEPGPMSAADATQISTREAELEVIGGASRQYLDESGVAADRAGYRGRKFKLHQHQQECIIGRDKGCDLVVLDPDPTVNQRISRQHARVEYRPEEGMFRLYNRSGNGTFVKRLRSPVMDDVVLNDRDVFTIGRTAIQIRIRGMEATTGPVRRSKPATALKIIGLMMLIAGGLALAWSLILTPLLAGGTTPQATVAWALQLDRDASDRVEIAVGGAATNDRTRVFVSGGDGSVRAADGSTGVDAWNQVIALEGPWVVGQSGVDVDLDGVDDLVVSSGSPTEHRGEVALLSGATGAVLWQGEPGCESGGCAYAGPPAFTVDANGDGLRDVVVAGASRRGGFAVLVDVRSGVELWLSRNRIGEVRQPPVTFDGPDGEPVVSVVTREGEVVTFDAASGVQVGGTGIVGAPPVAPPAVGDVDGDGDLELVVLNDVGQLAVVDPFFSGAPSETFLMEIDYNGIPLAALEHGRSTGPLVCDLNGDGRDDIVVAHPGYEDAPEMNLVFALRGPTLDKLWEYRIPDDFFALAPPAAADVDGDRVADVLIPISTFDGSEVALVVLAGAVDAPTRDLLFVPLSEGNAISAAPVVADIDGDDMLDVVLGLEGYGVQALRLGVAAHSVHPWPSLRGGAENRADGNIRLSVFDRLLRAFGVLIIILGLLLVAGGVVLQRRARWTL